LFDYWLEKRAIRKRSQKDDECRRRRHPAPGDPEHKLETLGKQIAA
jgi:hypothetical protein